MKYDIMNNQLTLILQEQPLLLEDLLEQEKREQQQQQPIPTAGTTPTTAQNLPPGAQPISHGLPLSGTRCLAGYKKLIQ